MRQNDHGRSENFEKAVRDAGFNFICLLEGIHPNASDGSQDLNKWYKVTLNHIKNELEMKKEK